MAAWAAVVRYKSTGHHPKRLATSDTYGRGRRGGAAGIASPRPLSASAVADWLADPRGAGRRRAGCGVVAEASTVQKASTSSDRRRADTPPPPRSRLWYPHRLRRHSGDKRVPQSETAQTAHTPPRPSQLHTGIGPARV